VVQLRNVMSDAAYLEPEQLAAQIVVIQTRTMRSLNAEAASGVDRAQSQVCALALMMDS
jgi:hypothetical protein